MPLTLTTEDIDAIADRVVTRIRSAAPSGGAAPTLLPFKLTVEQFACAIQRCRDHVRREIRARNIKASGKPYLINPTELSKFDVDQPLAVARLKAAGLLALPTQPPTAEPGAQRFVG
jgi:hypothetical protein